MLEVIQKLTKLNKTISTMESCTGGFLASSITNIEGSSAVFKFGAVTYSNEYKIKMGVSKDIIDTYSVYSKETSNEMSKCICNFANSNYGVGITGKLNKTDPNNKIGYDNIIYISIYDKDNDKFYNQTVSVTSMDRLHNKELLINIIIDMLNNIIEWEEI